MADRVRAVKDDAAARWKDQMDTEALVCIGPYESVKGWTLELLQDEVRVKFGPARWATGEDFGYGPRVRQCVWVPAWVAATLETTISEEEIRTALKKLGCNLEHREAVLSIARLGDMRAVRRFITEVIECEP